MILKAVRAAPDQIEGPPGDALIGMKVLASRVARYLIGWR